MGTLILLVVAMATADSPPKAPAPPQFQIGTLSGQTVTGEIVGLTDQELTVDVDRIHHPQTFALRDVRRLDRVSPPSARSEQQPVWIELTDGSRLNAASYEVTKTMAHLKLAAGEAIEIPTKWIAQVEFPLSDAPRSTWPELPKDQSADLIVVKKKEATDLVEGIAGDVTAESVHFTVDGENIPVKLAKVAGVVYFHPPESAAMPTPLCSITDLGGGKIPAKSVTLVDGKLQITATFGGSLTRGLDTVRSLDFSAGRLVYLSDLPTAAVDWTPSLEFAKAGDALGRLYQPRLDKSLDGGPLELAGKTYAKGLAVSSRTRMVYKLSGQGKSLQATVGIDDAVRDLGSVELTIRGDGRKLYEGKITGHDKPVDLDLDVADVKKLEIVVDFSEGLGAGNFLDLCDARIVK